MDVVVSCDGIPFSCDASVGAFIRVKLHVPFLLPCCKCFYVCLEGFLVFCFGDGFVEHGVICKEACCGVDREREIVNVGEKEGRAQY